MAPHVFLPSVYTLFLRDSDKVLLLRRRSDGNYTIPNGPLLENEKMVDAAKRVASEALGGDKASVGAAILDHVMRRHASGEDKLHFFYEIQAWYFVVSIGDPKTYDELIWTNIDHLPPNMDTHVYDFIHYIYPKPRIFSELGWGKERIPKVITKVTWF